MTLVLHAINFGCQCSRAQASSGGQTAPHSHLVSAGVRREHQTHTGSLYYGKGSMQVSSNFRFVGMPQDVVMPYERRQTEKCIHNICEALVPPEFERKL